MYFRHEIEFSQAYEATRLSLSVTNIDIILLLCIRIAAVGETTYHRSYSFPKSEDVFIYRSYHIN